MPSTTQTIAGVERALDVLGLFAASDAADLGVTEIAEDLGLSKAVVHRILSSFRVKGFVDLDERTHRYRLGPRMLTVGLAYLNRVDAAAVARDALEELAARTGETATQSVRAADEAVYVGTQPSPRRIRVVVRIGASFPLHAGCASKVLLAHLPEGQRWRYLEGDLRAVGDGGTVDTTVLERELARIRDQGWSASFGEREAGTAALAAPVFAHDGRVVSALGLCGPEVRFRDRLDDHREVLVEVAARASHALGWDAAA